VGRVLVFPVDNIPLPMLSAIR